MKIVRLLNSVLLICVSAMYLLDERLIALLRVQRDTAIHQAPDALATADQWQEHSKNLELLVDRETAALSNLNVFIQARLTTNGVWFQSIPWSELTNSRPLLSF